MKRNNEKPFNYNLAIYNNGICSLDNPDEFMRISEEMQNIDIYFASKTIHMDEVRNSILMSYLFEKKLNFNKSLTFKNRINYIRGIIYSKHYVNTNDLYEFLPVLESFDTSEFNSSTIFSQINYENDIEQENIIEELLEDNIPKEQLEINSLNNPNNINNMNENFDDSYLPEDEDYFDPFETDLEESPDSKPIGIFLIPRQQEIENDYMLLSPEDKLIYIKESFETYMDTIISIKKITNKREIKYVKKGMIDWFNYIYELLNDVYDYNKSIEELNDKSLIKSI